MPGFIVWNTRVWVFYTKLILLFFCFLRAICEYFYYDLSRKWASACGWSINKYKYKYLPHRGPHRNQKLQTSWELKKDERFINLIGKQYIDQKTDLGDDHDEEDMDGMSRQKPIAGEPAESNHVEHEEMEEEKMEDSDENAEKKALLPRNRRTGKERSERLSFSCAVKGPADRLTNSSSWRRHPRHHRNMSDMDIQ